METYEPLRDGGLIVEHLQQCLDYVKSGSSSTIIFEMNDVSIYVYKDSSFSDLCDKFDMARKIAYKQY